MCVGMEHSGDIEHMAQPALGSQEGEDPVRRAVGMWVSMGCGGPRWEQEAAVQLRELGLRAGAWSLPLRPPSPVCQAACTPGH